MRKVSKVLVKGTVEVHTVFKRFTCRIHLEIVTQDNFTHYKNEKCTVFIAERLIQENKLLWLLFACPKGGLGARSSRLNNQSVTQIKSTDFYLYLFIKCFHYKLTGSG